MNNFKVCISYTAKANEQNQWDYALSNFKPDQLFVLNRKNQEVQKSNVVGKATQIQSLTELPEDHKLVLLAPLNSMYMKDEKINLMEYKHPEDKVIYFAGDDSSFLIPDEFERYPDEIIYVPTDTKDDMYSWVAMAVVLYDRKLKSNS